MNVRVEHPIARIKCPLHRGADGVPVDAGADLEVGDVVLVRHRPVASQEYKRALPDRDPPIEEPDTLGGVCVRPSQVAEYLLVQETGQADDYGHVSARSRRATICVSVTFSFACQEKACYVRPRMWMLPFQFFSHGVFTRSAKKSRYS